MIVCRACDAEVPEGIRCAECGSVLAPHPGPPQGDGTPAHDGPPLPAPVPEAALPPAPVHAPLLPRGGPQAGGSTVPAADAEVLRPGAPASAAAPMPVAAPARQLPAPQVEPARPYASPPPAAAAPAVQRSTGPSPAAGGASHRSTMAVVAVVVALFAVGAAFLLGRSSGDSGDGVVDATSASSSTTTDAGAGSGSASPDQSQAERDQAEQVDRLLDSAAVGRGLIGPAVLHLGNCDGSITPDEAVADIQQATDNRSALLDQLEGTSFDALTGGQDLKAVLRRAWSRSLEADQHYLAWASAIQSGAPCDPTDAEKKAGDASSVGATQAKKEFVAAWNAEIAGPLGLSPRKETQL